MKILVVLLTFIGICSCSSKQWKLDVNFNNPKNWDSGKLPCASNRIIFPDTVNTVLFQTNISSVREIILPRNGQIVMTNDMVLSFSDTSSDSDCDGGDVNFVRTESESWFDPDNWQDLDNLVTVETERVPCQYDSVLFPDDKLFSVGLDGSVTIGKMSFSGKEYTSSLFASFLNSEAGKLQFTTTNSASVIIQGNTCPQTSGCPCGNDGAETSRTICNQYNCLPTSCTDAVTPVGGCCALCGAILTMEYDVTTFNMATFNKKIHDTYHVHDSPATTNNRKRRELDTGEVDTYISKTSKGQIQLVLTDKGSGSSSGQRAIGLAQQIKTDMQNDPGSFGITSVEMQSSKKGTGAQTSGGTVAGIVIAIIIIVIVICTLGFMFIRRRWMFFGKDDTPLNADMEGIPGVFGMEDIPGQPPPIHMQNFDNPLYDTNTAQENLYDDPTRVHDFADLAAADTGDLKKPSKKSKKDKGLPPSMENLDQHDGMAGFVNPNYSTMMGMDLTVAASAEVVDEHDGMKGFSSVGFGINNEESES